MYADDVKEVRCPKCGGHTWDNRATKTNPKAPDFKCKDKQCDGVIWPDKGPKAAGPRVPQPSTRPVATSGKEPYSSGGPIPGVDNVETGAPPAVASKIDGFQRLFNHYDVCMDHALTVARKMETAGVGSDPEAVAAIAATLLIQADRQGLTR